jgi:hypothetical protein
MSRTPTGHHLGWSSTELCVAALRRADLSALPPVFERRFIASLGPKQDIVAGPAIVPEVASSQGSKFGCSTSVRGGIPLIKSAMSLA